VVVSLIYDIAILFFCMSEPDLSNYDGETGLVFAVLMGGIENVWTEEPKITTCSRESKGWSLHQSTIFLLEPMQSFGHCCYSAATSQPYYPLLFIQKCHPGYILPVTTYSRNNHNPLWPPSSFCMPQNYKNSSKMIYAASLTLHHCSSVWSVNEAGEWRIDMWLFGISCNPCLFNHTMYD
jgi:hypothetical protein